LRSFAGEITKKKQRGSKRKGQSKHNKYSLWKRLLLKKLFHREGGGGLYDLDWNEFLEEEVFWEEGK